MTDKKKKILVVDDERDLIETLRYRLEAAEFEFCVAYDGLEAIEKTKKELPDLILLDIMMPRMDGYQACKIIKQDRALKHIPIVILSAKGQEIDKVRGKEAGADGFIVKPFEGKGLVETILKYLKK